jgi:hypothetical protein
MSNLHPLFAEIVRNFEAAIAANNGKTPDCESCGGSGENGLGGHCRVCEGSGIEPDPTMENIPAYVREMIEQPQKTNILKAARLFGIYEPWAARKRCAEHSIPDADAHAGAALADYRRAVKQIMAVYHGSPEYGAVSWTREEMDAIAEGERKIVDARALDLPLPLPWSLASGQIETARAAVARKPASFEQLTLEEKLVASTAIANYRKEKRNG